MKWWRKWNYNFNDEPLSGCLDYENIAKYYGGEEFKKRLILNVRESLKESLGEEGATNLLENLRDGVIKPVNTTSFFNSRSFTNDIGTECTRLINKLNGAEVQTRRYMYSVCEEIKKRLAKRETYIDLTSIFIYLAHYTESLDLNEREFDYLITGVAGLTASMYNDIFNIHIFLPEDLKKVTEMKNLGECSNYYKILNAYLKELSLTTDIYNKEHKPPHVSIVMPITDDTLHKQKQYLKKVFELPDEEINSIIKGLPSLSIKSMELIGAISRLKNASERYSVNVYGVMNELRKIAEETPINTYEQPLKYKEEFEKTLSDFNGSKTPLDIDFVYPWAESFMESPIEQYAEIRINCSKIDNLDFLEVKIGASAELLAYALRRNVEYSYVLATTVKKYDPVLKISLVNVRDLTKTFLHRIKKFEKELCSKFNKKFLIIPYFDPTLANTEKGKPKPEYIRVISDIHADVNIDRNYIFDFGNDFVINCGDTSGDLFTTRDWVRTYIKQGINVTGNHLGYTDIDLMDNVEGFDSNGRYYNLKSKTTQVKWLTEKFLNTDTPFIERKAYNYQDMIIFGGTLYSDFCLFGKDNQWACEAEAKRSMNDFRRCKLKYGHKLIPFTPKKHFETCRKTLQHILFWLDRRRMWKWQPSVVIVTHFAPTPYSVADRYKNDPLSAAFASDFRQILNEYPEIRLWVHGHIHDKFDYIYNETRVICNPFGYSWENGNEFKTQEDLKNYGTRVKIADITSEESWKDILKKDIKKGLIKVYEKDEDVQKVFEKGQLCYDI